MTTRWSTFAIALLGVSCSAGNQPAKKQAKSGGPAEHTPDASVNKSAPPPSVVSVSCDPVLPRAACGQLKRFVDANSALEWSPSATANRLRVCSKTGNTDRALRVGTWHYAVAAPLHTLEQQVASPVLKTMWKQRHKTLGLSVGRETHKLFLSIWGAPAPPTGGPGAAEPSRERWSLIPADRLTPRWKAIAVDGVFPLAGDIKKAKAKAKRQSALAIGLCLDIDAAGKRAFESAKLNVSNIDASRSSLLIMTGVTAPTRNTGMLMDRKGPAYPARDIAPWFADANFVHISNEVSFKPGCKMEKRGIVFCAKPSYIKLLETVGANIIELTGSHLSDRGRKWIPHSLAMYRKRGWRWFGGGADQIAATRPLKLEHHGNKLAFIGCNVERSEHKLIRNAPGVAFCDFRRMRRQVRDLRRAGYLPIVSVQHWERYSYAPTQRMVNEFRRFANDGAAFVLGSQAHQAKPWEAHAGAFLHYGPGNLFFDQMSLATRRGTVNRLYFHKGRLLNVEMRYTMVEERGRPRAMTKRQRRAFLQTMHGEARKIRPLAKPAAKPKLAAKESRQRVDSMVIRKGKRTLRFLAYVPKRVAAGPPSKRWPLIVYLHGTDMRGTNVNKVRNRGIPNKVDTLDDFPFIVVSPQIAYSTSRWSTKLVMELVEFVSKKYPVDTKRIYLTGISLGTFGVYATAVRNPSRFAALVAVSGGGEDWRACAIKRVPVWAFHNRGDLNVKVERSQQMIDAIKRCGGSRTKLTIYPGAGHNAWDRAFGDASLYTWLAAQRN